MKPLSICFIVFTLALLGFSTYQALVVAPTEQTMGDVQRIFYYHVPSAWVAGVCFFVNFLASIVYMWKRSSNADALAAASAEVGVVFCTIVLITGPIWARPVWGIWWTWDARLTTTLVLWLIYVSYLDAAPLRRRRTDAGTGGGAGDLRIRGCADRLYVDPLVPHPASVARHGRRRELGSRSRDVACLSCGTCWRSPAWGSFWWRRATGCRGWKTRWNPRTRNWRCREVRDDRIRRLKIGIRGRMDHRVALHLVPAWAAIAECAKR